MRIDNDANATTIPAAAPAFPTEAKPVAEKEPVAEKKARPAAAKAPEAPAEKETRRPRLTGKLKQKTAKPASKAKAKAAPKSKPAARKPGKAAKPAPKAETSGESRPPLRDNQVVRVLPAGKENPRRPGTAQWDQYEVIRKSDGREVDEVVARGAPRTAIRYAQDCGLIEVEG